MASRRLLEAVAVTAELCGRTFSEAAARVFVEDLHAYREDQVLGALARCRREVRGMLTVHDVESRLDDGRPGVEEAWSMLPRDESQTVVWTDEMAKAFAPAMRLLDTGDKVAARMAFKERYIALVSAARSAGKPVAWSASIGQDRNGRAGPLLEAVQAGRLTAEHVSEYVQLPMAEPKRMDGPSKVGDVLKLMPGKIGANAS